LPICFDCPLGPLASRLVNKKLFVVLVTTALIGISGVGVAGAQATIHFPLSPMSEENAVRKAEQYLQMGGYSRQGLIEQLEYEEFSESDAEYAVANVTVDWNQQAVIKAKQYLKMQGYSHEGLVEQLEYEKFTPAQAEYGAAGVGL
jgi:Host cell surface-exposed lipoprotein